MEVLLEIKKLVPLGILLQHHFIQLNLGCYGDGGAILPMTIVWQRNVKPLEFTEPKKDKYNSEMIGLNGRLDSIQAAVLLEKLSIFDEELAMRSEIDKKYRLF